MTTGNSRRQAPTTRAKHRKHTPNTSRHKVQRHGMRTEQHRQGDAQSPMRRVRLLSLWPRRWMRSAMPSRPPGRKVRNASRKKAMRGLKSAHERSGVGQSVVATKRLGRERGVKQQRAERQGARGRVQGAGPQPDARRLRKERHDVRKAHSTAVMTSKLFSPNCCDSLVASPCNPTPKQPAEWHKDQSISVDWFREGCRSDLLHDNVLRVRPARALQSPAQ